VIDVVPNNFPQKSNGNLNPELFEAAGVAVSASVTTGGPAVPAANSGFRVTVLDEFAAEIRAGHAAVQKAVSNALDEALHTGDVLLAARDRISTRWIEWLQEECKINRKTAHLYMKLAGKRDEIEKARAQVPDLSLRGAYRLITKGPKLITTKPSTESANENSNKGTGEDSNKSEEPELSPLDRLLTTTPASEVAVEFAKQGRDVPWLLERLPRPWIPKLTDRVANLPRTRDEPFIKASEVLRTALSAVNIADAPKTTLPVAQSQEKVALNGLRALNVLLARAGIDEVTIVRMHAKESRCVVEKRRRGRRGRRRA
jgi:hypothetical protein